MDRAVDMVSSRSEWRMQKILQAINYIESLSLFDHNAEKRGGFFSFLPRDRDEPNILTYSLF